MINTFLCVLDAARGGPYLHTHLPITSSCASVLGLHVVTTPHEGHPFGVESTHLVPWGQQVSPLPQHVAFAHGQQPFADCENLFVQHVAPSGQRGSSIAPGVPVHTFGQADSRQANAVSANSIIDVQRETSVWTK